MKTLTHQEWDVLLSTVEVARDEYGKTAKCARRAGKGYKTLAREYGFYEKQMDTIHRKLMLARKEGK